MSRDHPAAYLTVIDFLTFVAHYIATTLRRITVSQVVWHFSHFGSPITHRRFYCHRTSPVLCDFYSYSFEMHLTAINHHAFVDVCIYSN